MKKQGKKLVGTLLNSKGVECAIIRNRGGVYDILRIDHQPLKDALVRFSTTLTEPGSWLLAWDRDKKGYITIYRGRDYSQFLNAVLIQDENNEWVLFGVRGNKRIVLGRGKKHVSAAGEIVIGEKKWLPQKGDKNFLDFQLPVVQNRTEESTKASCDVKLLKDTFCHHCEYSYDGEELNWFGRLTNHLISLRSFFRCGFRKETC